MSIKRINEFPEGSGSLSNDDVFLFMDDPSGAAVTKKISLSQVAAAIGSVGGTGSADTGDVSFSGLQIIGTGTLELVPNSDLYNNDQYLIVDPTAPNHIHLRAGGNIDESNAELIVGGEKANLSVRHNDQRVRMQTETIVTNNEYYLNTGSEFSSAVWETVDNVNKVVINNPTQSVYDAVLGFSEPSVFTVYNNDLNSSLTVSSSSTPGGSDPIIIYVDEAPPTNPTSLNQLSFAINQFSTSYIHVNGSDIRMEAADDVRIYSNDVFRLYNNSSSDPIEIVTDYNGDEYWWRFEADGNLSIPGNILLDNGTSVAVGSYDNNTGGQNGVSLNCAVGYELNWQGGHLRSSEIGNSSTTQPLFVDSPIQIPGTGVSNMTISASGLTFPDGTSQISAITGGGGLSDSDRYIICKAGDDIIAKYNEAKTLTPGGSVKSATNRAYLIIMPGVYPLSAQWEIDAEFVDVIGLGSTPLDRGCNVSVTVTGYDINVSANNVRIKGVGTTSDRAFKIDGDKPLQVFEECIGGFHEVAIDEFTTLYYYSFGGGSTASGSFKDCSGGDHSFGGNGGTANGSFINCVGGDYSFGGGGIASGSFKDCSGGDHSFGGNGGIASGSFKDCSGGDHSFGDGGTANGSFINCSGGTGSFGGGGSTASGHFVNCVGGDYSFGGGNGGIASGSFKDCSGGDHSFGGNGGIASGSFKDCSGGDHSFGGGGTASGSFVNCVGGDYSFGGNGGTASGKFLRCTLTTGSFPTLSGSGKYRLCIDGSYNIVNADAPTP